MTDGIGQLEDALLPTEAELEAVVDKPHVVRDIRGNLAAVAQRREEEIAREPAAGGVGVHDLARVLEPHDRIVRLHARAIGVVFAHRLVATAVETALAGASGKPALDEACDEFVAAQRHVEDAVALGERSFEAAPDGSDELEADVVEQAKDSGAGDAERAAKGGIGKLVAHAVLAGGKHASGQPVAAHAVGDKARGVAAVEGDLAQLLLDGQAQRRSRVVVSGDKLDQAHDLGRIKKVRNREGLGASDAFEKSRQRQRRCIRCEQRAVFEVRLDLRVEVVLGV